MRKARKELSLSDFGIPDLRTKRAITEALRFEVPGVDGT